jgi:type VI secretion system protein ImpC
MTRLPFTIGVLADCSNGANPTPLRERRFRVIDARTFDDYLASRHPEVAIPVDRIDEPTAPPTETAIIRFDSIIDFEPEAIARMVPAMARLLDFRSGLTDLLESLKTDYNVEDVFSEIMTNAEVRSRFYEEGVSALAHLPCWIQATSRRSGERVAMLERQLDDLVRCQAMLPARVSREPANMLRAAIDKLSGLLGQAIDRLLSHPDVRRAEATWRSLHLLVRETEIMPDVNIAVLDCTKQELIRDFRRRDDPSKSMLHAKIYDEAFGGFGGQPFGILVGDWAFSHEQDDLDVLRTIGTICDAAKTAFVASPTPRLLGCHGFQELAGATDLASLSRNPGYAGWYEFRARASARRVILVAPRFSLRPPYANLAFADASLIFSESGGPAMPEDGLWANPAYLLAIEAARSFTATGWFGRTGVEAGGGGGTARRCGVESAIPAGRALSLIEFGVTPLCQMPSSGSIGFPSITTCYRPRAAAIGIERHRELLGTRLDVLLDIGRLTHLAKVYMQEKLYATIEPAAVIEVFATFLSSFSLTGSCFEGKIETRLERPDTSVREYIIAMETAVRAGPASTPIAISVTGLL